MGSKGNTVVVVVDVGKALDEVTVDVVLMWFGSDVDPAVTSVVVNCPLAVCAVVCTADVDVLEGVVVVTSVVLVDDVSVLGLTVVDVVVSAWSSSSGNSVTSIFVIVLLFTI